VEIRQIIMIILKTNNYIDTISNSRMIKLAISKTPKKKLQNRSPPKIKLSKLFSNGTKSQMESVVETNCNGISCQGSLTFKKN
jgi:hypothetical protein